MIPIATRAQYSMSFTTDVPTNLQLLHARPIKHLIPETTTSPLQPLIISPTTEPPELGQFAPSYPVRLLYDGGNRGGRKLKETRGEKKRQGADGKREIRPPAELGDGCSSRGHIPPSACAEKDSPRARDDKRAAMRPRI